MKLCQCNFFTNLNLLMSESVYSFVNAKNYENCMFIEISICKISLVHRDWDTLREDIMPLQFCHFFSGIEPLKERICSDGVNSFL